MQSPGELQSIVQAAIMYYKEHLNQQEIAERMGVTRQTVSKHLRNAEKCGVVEFRIHNPMKALEDLSKRLAHRFHLQNTLVAPCRFEDPILISNMLAQYAGEYLVEQIERGARNIGLSWGRTVYRTVLNMPAAHCEDAVVFPLAGASNQTAEYFMINEIVRRAADTICAVPAYAYIPADPGSKEDAALFRRTSTYETIARHWSHIDLAVVGIGTTPDSEVGLRAAYPGEHYLRNVARDNAVGDILTHYFDAEGNFLPLNEEAILCASVDNLKNARRMLAIAGGKSKTAALRAALKTGILTDLITDEQTCNRLLRMK